MFVMADKYLVEALKALSAAKFEARAAAGWRTPGFAAAITEIYNSVPAHDDRLKGIALQEVNKHRGELLKRSFETEAFRKMMRENAAFAADMSETGPSHDGTQYTACISLHLRISSSFFGIDRTSSVCRSAEPRKLRMQRLLLSRRACAVALRP